MPFEMFAEWHVLSCRRILFESMDIHEHFFIPKFFFDGQFSSWPTLFLLWWSLVHFVSEMHCDLRWWPVLFCLKMLTGVKSSKCREWLDEQIKMTISVFLIHFFCYCWRYLCLFDRALWMCVSFSYLQSNDFISEVIDFILLEVICIVLL